uniref:Replication factor A C-terminal domain-containing protein n=1 Tax=Oryza punctata TaxID=4537 RepID=A0A0E0LWN2_ORYPU
MYNTKVKQVKESDESFPEYYFDFASIDTLQDRANKDQHLSGLSLRSSSATRIYTNLHIRETWTLIDRQSSEETVATMMEVDKSTQGTRKEQMFYNRKTLEMRHGNPGSQEFVFTSKVTIDRVQENIQWWYQLRLLISDHTTSTSCTIFDDVAQTMLETPVSSLLNLLDGKSDEIPNIIQQLCGKQLIFKFKLSEQNLTEGTPNYVVKRTFVPNYMLEKQYLVNKAEEELMDDEVDNILNKIERQINSCKQIRWRTYIIEDDSEEESNETSMIKSVDAKVQGKNAKNTHAKSTKAEIRDDNYNHEINKAVVEESIKAGKRQAKTINGIGKKSSV